MEHFISSLPLGMLAHSLLVYPNFMPGSPGSEEVLQLANLPPVIRKGRVNRRAGHRQGKLLV